MLGNGDPVEALTRGGSTRVDNAFYRLTRVSARIMVLERRPDRFERLEQLDATFALIHAALEHVDRAACTLVVDLRDGPHRADATFEHAMRRHRGPLLAGWRRIGFAVSTQAGALQMARHMREDGMTNASVFADASELTAFASS